MKNKKEKIGLIKRLESRIFHGTTLLEVLGVGIIFSVIAVVTIPTITKVIKNYKNNMFATTIHGLIDATSYKVSLQQYETNSTDITYYLPTKCVPVETGGDTPFGDFEESYVVVTFDGEKYEYYYTGRDSENHGVVLTHRNLLEKENIEEGIDKLDLTIGVGERKTIRLYNNNCNKDMYEEYLATKLIEDKTSLKDGIINIEE